METAFRPLADILADFARPIPREYLAFKPKKSKDHPGYVNFSVALTWKGTVKLMNQFCPAWSFVIPHGFQVIGDWVATTARVSIPTADAGVIVREMSASVPMAGEGFGDPVTQAQHKAVRKALAYFGLGANFACPDIWMELKPNGYFPKYDERKAVNPWDGKKQASESRSDERTPPGRRDTRKGSGSKEGKGKGLHLGDLKTALHSIGIVWRESAGMDAVLFHRAASDDDYNQANKGVITPGGEKVCKMANYIHSLFDKMDPGADKSYIPRQARLFLQKAFDEGLDISTPAGLDDAFKLLVKTNG